MELLWIVLVALPTSEVYQLSRSELSVILLGLDVADPFIKKLITLFYEHTDLDRHQNNVVIHPVHAASWYAANILAQHDCPLGRTQTPSQVAHDSPQQHVTWSLCMNVIKERTGL